MSGFPLANAPPASARAETASRSSVTAKVRGISSRRLEYASHFAPGHPPNGGTRTRDGSLDRGTPFPAPHPILLEPSDHRRTALASHQRSAGGLGWGESAAGPNGLRSAARGRRPIRR